MAAVVTAAFSSTAKFKVPCNSSPLVRRAMAKPPLPKDFVKYFTKPLSSRCPMMKTTTSFTAPTDRSATSKRSSFFTCKSRIVSSNESRPGSDEVQVFCVYEFNHFDRCGPHGAYLKLSGKAENSLGDLLPYTNTLYSGDLQKRLGITEGLCVFIQNKAEKDRDRYEAISSLYFGDFGHISIQGPYLTYYEDTFLAVTGGTGVFEGVYGQVRLKQLVFPSKIFYTFYLKGIKDLPQELVWDPVVPSPTDELHPSARACEPNFTLPNYTD